MKEMREKDKGEIRDVQPSYTAQLLSPKVCQVVKGLILFLMTTRSGKAKDKKEDFELVDG